MATALVTGANRGIGLEYCRQLQARGDQVVAVCREPSPELEALGVRIEAGVELTDPAAIADLVERLQGLALDVVILNAGLLQSMGLDDLDALRRPEVGVISERLDLPQPVPGRLADGHPSRRDRTAQVAKAQNRQPWSRKNRSFCGRGVR